MADMDKIVSKVVRSGNMSTKERVKFFEKLLTDDSFIRYIFGANQNVQDPAKKKAAMQQIGTIYEEFTSNDSIKAFNKILKNYEGEDRYDFGIVAKKPKFNRTHATFFNSLIRMTTEELNKQISVLSGQKRSGKITNAEYRDRSDEIEEQKEDLVKLSKKLGKLVKPEAKRIYEDCGMPVPIIKQALLSTPQPDLINRFQTTYYINNTLNIIYETAFNMEEGSCKGIGTKTWKRFFFHIFGERNVIECATFILLEGIHRYNKYQDSTNVKAIWDSLTNFALDTLNDAPEKMREQMMDIYTKKIEKMFKNEPYDLRVDLRQLSKIDYPNLFRTVSKYIGTITGIIEKVTK